MPKNPSRGRCRGSPPAAATGCGARRCPGPYSSRPSSTTWPCRAPAPRRPSRRFDRRCSSAPFGTRAAAASSCAGTRCGRRTRRPNAPPRPGRRRLGKRPARTAPAGRLRPSAVWASRPRRAGRRGSCGGLRSSCQNRCFSDDRPSLLARCHTTALDTIQKRCV